MLVGAGIMFTGIIEAVGEIVACEPRGGDLRLRVKTFGLDPVLVWVTVSPPTVFV